MNLLSLKRITAAFLSAAMILTPGTPSSFGADPVNSPQSGIQEKPFIPEEESVKSEPSEGEDVSSGAVWGAETKTLESADPAEEKQNEIQTFGAETKTAAVVRVLSAGSYDLEGGGEVTIREDGSLDFINEEGETIRYEASASQAVNRISCSEDGAMCARTLKAGIPPAGYEMIGTVDHVLENGRYEVWIYASNRPEEQEYPAQITVDGTVVSLDMANLIERMDRTANASVDWFMEPSTHQWLSLLPGVNQVLTAAELSLLPCSGRGNSDIPCIYNTEAWTEVFTELIRSYKASGFNVLQADGDSYKLLTEPFLQIVENGFDYLQKVLQKQTEADLRENFGITEAQLDAWQKQGLLEIKIDAAADEIQVIFAAGLKGVVREGGRAALLGNFHIPEKIIYRLSDSMDAPQTIPGPVSKLTLAVPRIVSAEVIYGEDAEASDYYGVHSYNRIELSYGHGGLAEAVYLKREDIVCVTAPCEPVETVSKRIVFHRQMPCTGEICVQGFAQNYADVTYPGSEGVVRARVHLNDGGFVSLLTPMGGITKIEEFVKGENGAEEEGAVSEFIYSRGIMPVYRGMPNFPGALEQYSLWRKPFYFEPVLKEIRRTYKGELVSTIYVSQPYTDYLRPFEIPEMETGIGRADMVIDQPVFRPWIKGARIVSPDGRMEWISAVSLEIMLFREAREFEEESETPVTEGKPLAGTLEIVPDDMPSTLMHSHYKLTLDDGSVVLVSRADPVVRQILDQYAGAENTPLVELVGELFSLEGQRLLRVTKAFVNTKGYIFGDEFKQYKDVMKQEQITSCPLDHRIGEPCMSTTSLYEPGYESLHWYSSTRTENGRIITTTVHYLGLPDKNEIETAEVIDEARRKFENLKADLDERLTAQGAKGPWTPEELAARSEELDALLLAYRDALNVLMTELKEKLAQLGWGHSLPQPRPLPNADAISIEYYLYNPDLRSWPGDARTLTQEIQQHFKSVYESYSQSQILIDLGDEGEVRIMVKDIIEGFNQLLFSKTGTLPGGVFSSPYAVESDPSLLLKWFPGLRESDLPPRLFAKRYGDGTWGVKDPFASGLHHLTLFLGVQLEPYSARQIAVRFIQRNIEAFKGLEEEAITPKFLELIQAEEPEPAVVTEARAALEKIKDLQQKASEASEVYAQDMKVWAEVRGLESQLSGMVYDIALVALDPKVERYAGLTELIGRLESLIDEGDAAGLEELLETDDVKEALLEESMQHVLDYLSSLQERLAEGEARKAMVQKEYDEVTAAIEAVELEINSVLETLETFAAAHDNWKAEFESMKERLTAAAQELAETAEETGSEEIKELAEKAAEAFSILEEILEKAPVLTSEIRAQILAVKNLLENPGIHLPGLRGQLERMNEVLEAAKSELDIAEPKLGEMEGLVEGFNASRNSLIGKTFTVESSMQHPVYGTLKVKTTYKILAYSDRIKIFKSAVLIEKENGDDVQEWIRDYDITHDKLLHETVIRRTDSGDLLLGNMNNVNGPNRYSYQALGKTEGQVNSITMKAERLFFSFDEYGLLVQLIAYHYPQYVVMSASKEGVVIPEAYPHPQKALIPAGSEYANEIEINNNHVIKIDWEAKTAVETKNGVRLNFSNVEGLTAGSEPCGYPDGAAGMLCQTVPVIPAGKQVIGFYSASPHIYLITGTKEGNHVPAEEAAYLEAEGALRERLEGAGIPQNHADIVLQALVRKSVKLDQSWSNGCAGLGLPYDLCTQAFVHGSAVTFELFGLKVRVHAGRVSSEFLPAVKALSTLLDRGYAPGEISRLNTYYQGGSYDSEIFHVSVKINRGPGELWRFEIDRWSGLILSEFFSAGENSPAAIEAEAKRLITEARVSIEALFADEAFNGPIAGENLKEVYELLVSKRREVRDILERAGILMQAFIGSPEPGDEDSGIISIPYNAGKFYGLPHLDLFRELEYDAVKADKAAYEKIAAASIIVDGVVIPAKEISDYIRSLVNGRESLIVDGVPKAMKWDNTREGLLIIFPGLEDSMIPPLNRYSEYHHGHQQVYGIFEGYATYVLAEPRGMVIRAEDIQYIVKNFLAARLDDVLNPNGNFSMDLFKTALGLNEEALGSAELRTGSPAGPIEPADDQDSPVTVLPDTASVSTRGINVNGRNAYKGYVTSTGKLSWRYDIGPAADAGAETVISAAAGEPFDLGDALKLRLNRENKTSAAGVPAVEVILKDAAGKEIKRTLNLSTNGRAGFYNIALGEEDFNSSAVTEIVIRMLASHMTAAAFQAQRRGSFSVDLGFAPAGENPGENNPPAAPRINGIPSVKVVPGSKYATIAEAKHSVSEAQKPQFDAAVRFDTRHGTNDEALLEISGQNGLELTDGVLSLRAGVEAIDLPVSGGLLFEVIVTDPQGRTAVKQLTAGSSVSEHRIDVKALNPSFDTASRVKVTLRISALLDKKVRRGLLKFGLEYNAELVLMN